MYNILMFLRNLYSMCLALQLYRGCVFLFSPVTTIDIVLLADVV
jgi:hypothetical protein